MTIDEIKILVCDSGKKLLSEGYVSGTWGNISHRINNHLMAITPSGLPYETMDADDIVIVNYIDHFYQGKRKPSSEFKLHTEIFRTRRNIMAVIHTHQTNASIVAATRTDVPPILDDMAQIIGPSIRCTKYEHSNTVEIVQATVAALKGRFAALMANHGAVCIGRDMDEAFVVCQVLEKACKAFIEGAIIGGAKEIPKDYAVQMHQSYLEDYSRLRNKY